MNKFIEKLKYLLPILGAYLGALGGQGDKEWRRIVLPIIFSVIGALSLQSWLGILLGTFGAWTAIGYGVPDATDSGSTLGRFWYNLFNGNHLLTDIFTRGTVGLGMCLTGIIVPLLKSNWMPYLLGCLFIMIGQTVFSYRAWGEVEVFGKNLLVSDLINYGLIFVGYFIMLATI